VNLVFAGLNLGQCWACWQANKQSFCTCTSFKVIHIILQFSQSGKKLSVLVGLQILQALLSASDDLPGITALAGTLGAILNCEKHFKILFIYTPSKLPLSFFFFFFFPHRLIIKIAVNVFWRGDLPIYHNFVCACCYVLFLSTFPHSTGLVGKCESYYGNRE